MKLLLFFKFHFLLSSGSKTLSQGLENHSKTTNLMHEAKVMNFKVRLPCCSHLTPGGGKTPIWNRPGCLLSRLGRWYMVQHVSCCSTTYYTLLAELRNHVFWSRVGLSTHINTFSKFHSNTAAVSVAMLDLSTKPHGTKLENHWWTSFNKRQLVERNRLKLYSVQQRSTTVQHVERHVSTFNNTWYSLFNISWAHLLLNKCWTMYHWL